jgi:hypothetical protein
MTPPLEKMVSTAWKITPKAILTQEFMKKIKPFLASKKI